MNLRIKNPNHNPNLPDSNINFPYIDVTENKQIYSELHDTFRQIYKEQPNLDTSQNALEDFLNSDNDTEPLKELNKRKLTLNQSRKMEGLLTTKELTYSLFNTMKADSSPGVDGFTVNYLCTFWDDLKAITTNALNSSLGNKLTSTLRLAIVKLLRKGQKDPTLPGNYRPISLLSIFYKLPIAFYPFLVDTILEIFFV